MKLSDLRKNVDYSVYELCHSLPLFSISETVPYNSLTLGKTRSIQKASLLITGLMHHRYKLGGVFFFTVV